MIYQINMALFISGLSLGVALEMRSRGDERWLFHALPGVALIGAVILHWTVFQ